MLNIKNRTIFNKDNLDILQNINSNCVDLIYLDPPFNKNKVFSHLLEVVLKEQILVIYLEKRMSKTNG